MLLLFYFLNHFNSKGTPGQPKRTYNKQNSLLKKQQKLMMQQQRDVQQQLEHQLKIQMTQAQFAGGSNQEQFAAAVAAASQFANLFEMQQMLALQQQISQNSPGTPNIPSTSGIYGFIHLKIGLFYLLKISFF